MAFFVIPSVDNDAIDKDGNGDGDGNGDDADCRVTGEVVVLVDVEVVMVFDVDVVVLIEEVPFEIKFERIELELSPLFESGTRIYSIRGVAYIIFFTFFFFFFCFVTFLFFKLLFGFLPVKAEEIVLLLLLGKGL